MRCFNIGLGLNNNCSNCNLQSDNSNSNVNFEDVLYEISKIKDVNREQNEDITTLKDDINTLNNSLNTLTDLLNVYNNTLNNLIVTTDTLNNKVNNSVNNLSFREGFLTYHFNNNTSQTLDIRCNTESTNNKVITEISNFEIIDNNYVFTLSKGVLYNGFIGVIVNDEDRIQISYTSDTLQVKVPIANLNLQTGDKLKLMFKDTTYTEIYGYSQTINITINS